ncbi:uncharacterized protein MKK02DRAFT_16490 [Dioszegia hungarica]|uniref:Ubiquitin thioesterase OTU n=1 Tax=Dioszegia hungarica TaxID=4972 RepID=A0AA38LV09_9TREE|nr:uncharacterized protein MKK02DRAFT_16490 [Dioszegia hungarica]KAI9634711.1 hypothetical protein MKK02DRAFT_16490 [Dioszegia hungarica]
MYANTVPGADISVKYGYPPKAIPATNGPLSSIPITRGEQIIVTSVPPTAAPEPATNAPVAPTPTPGPSIKHLNETISAPSPHPAQPRPASQPSAESIPLPGRDAGYLQLRVVPDDNSCMFSALGVVFEGGMEAAGKLRQVAADEIRRDAETWSEVVLGQPRDSYISKISSKDAWGGAIGKYRVDRADAELSIFAKHYKTEISSFDVASGRCDRFGEGEYDSRCLLVYSGIHYDAITLSPVESAPPSFHTTVFPVSDDTIVSTAITLVSQLKARHYYTDTSNFDLRCGVCKIGLKGEKGAREHAMLTGHVEFGEY